MDTPLEQCLTALENLVGKGAIHERACNADAHDAEAACVYCNARDVLELARTGK